MTAKDYLENSNNCLVWAHQTVTPEIRESYLELALFWLLAYEEERKRGRIFRPAPVGEIV